MTGNGIGVLGLIAYACLFDQGMPCTAQSEAPRQADGPDVIDERTTDPEAERTHSAAEESPLGCHVRPEQWKAAMRAAVSRGEIDDPFSKQLPAFRPGPAQGRPPQDGATVMPSDIFAFEDSQRLLANTFSNGQLFNLLAEAANALLEKHGDNFDFVGYWLNYPASRQIGAAFYSGVENDVRGIGLPVFDQRASSGFAGSNIEGIVMMWNQASWTGTFPRTQALVTQLVLGQEFEHRFGLFLSPLQDGRRLQGNDGACGRSAHWNFRVDGQGSGMEVPEWVGSDPAVRAGDCPGTPTLCFNTDIGGVWSYTDLYLMGYVSPEEMDAGNSELRYMNENANCSSPYAGPITTLDSGDIIAANGPRIPDSNDEQRDYRTGWVMIHLPGAPPTADQLDRVATVLNDWTETWNFSTLGRGTMKNFFDCNENGLSDGQDLMEETSLDCNASGIPDECEIASGSSPDLDANGVPDECECFAPEAVTAEGDGVDRNRYLSFNPNGASASDPTTETGLQITLLNLDGFPDVHGEVRWVGPPSENPENADSDGPTFQASRLQCEPFFMDWTEIELLHVYGPEVVPSSRYEVRRSDVCCSEGADDSCISDALVVQTARWGDVVEPFDPPSTSNQPDFADLAALVAKFKGDDSAPIKASAQLQPNVPDPGLAVSFADISSGVDAFRGASYPFAGPDACP